MTARLSPQSSVLSPQHSSPCHIVRARRIAQRLALRLDDRRLRSAVAIDRFHEKADGAGAVNRAVTGVFAVDHARAGGGLLELYLSEPLKLVVEEGVAFQELRQLGGVERLVDAADAELRGGGADQREDVRHL